MKPRDARPGAHQLIEQLVFSLDVERGPAGVKSDAAQIFPPATINASAVRQWRTSVEAWRAAVLANLRYNGTVYGVPELEWTQTSYVQPQMHP